MLLLLLLVNYTFERETHRTRQHSDIISATLTAAAAAANSNREEKEREKEQIEMRGTFLFDLGESWALFSVLLSLSLSFSCLLSFLVGVEAGTTQPFIGRHFAERHVLAASSECCFYH